MTLLKEDLIFFTVTVLFYKRNYSYCSHYGHYQLLNELSFIIIAIVTLCFGWFLFLFNIQVMRHPALPVKDILALSHQ